MNSWNGHANGPSFTMAEKAERRREKDIPERFDQLLSQDIPLTTVAEAKASWRAGQFDLKIKNGRALFSMTPEQSAAALR